MGGVTTLLTFETKMEMDEKLIDEKLKVWFADLRPCCSSRMMREATLWVTLEEIPLQVWHEKFFAFLGNSWGKLVCIDDNTIKRKRFDIARLLVSVESWLSIPSSVNVNVRGIDFKILIIVEEEETVAEKSLVCIEVESSDDEDVLIEKNFDEGLNDAAYSQGNGGLLSSHKFDICPWLEQKSAGFHIDYNSMLSMDEMIGGCYMSKRYEWHVVLFINSLMDKGAGNIAKDENTNILGDGYMNLGPRIIQHSYGSYDC